MQMQMRTPVAGRKLCALPPLRATVSDVPSVSKKAVTAMTASFAALAAASPAFAAQQVAALAEEDNRLGAILLLFVPVVGWVGLNILGPINNQLKELKVKREKMMKAMAVALPLAAAVAAEQTQAAQEVTTVATSGVKFAGVALFMIAMGIWIAMFLYADNTTSLLEEDKVNIPK